MKLEMIRHATLILHLNGLKLLVDPVLGNKGTLSAVQGVPNGDSNPLVELPVPVETVIGCDAVLVTHKHYDHFDEKAQELLPKNIPLFCQPEDEEEIRGKGFFNVIPVHDSLSWNGITFHRTKGRHGYGELALKMAPVSGFVLQVPGEPSVYIMGDTVWYAGTKKAMEEFKPDIAVCNCGEARFSAGRAITMSTRDIDGLCSEFPEVRVVAVHMEAWNHCRLTRKALRDHLTANQLESRVSIPADGEVLAF